MPKPAPLDIVDDQVSNHAATSMNDPRWPRQWNSPTRQSVIMAAHHLREALSHLAETATYATRELALAMTHTEEATLRLREFFITCTYHETMRERASDPTLSTIDYLLPEIPKASSRAPDHQPSQSEGSFAGQHPRSVGNSSDE